ncbi:hypothetical protein QR680_000863 [Steinernema hermaphroditum]|uniref:G-protein coupled receptors family 1 profile domain-containing protein n=1 Tax=Steinernema hermaphroditum TaxID=289476 RepID=A0AA39GYX6_9BILA|nr:hypothetical protein QR680_000863 [Steinernema hermaphroditum]
MRLSHATTLLPSVTQLKYFSRSPQKVCAISSASFSLPSAAICPSRLTKVYCVRSANKMNEIKRSPHCGLFDSSLNPRAHTWSQGDEHATLLKTFHHKRGRFPLFPGPVFIPLPEELESNERQETMRDTDVGLLLRFELYIGFGAFAVLTNVLVLIVLWSKKEMRMTLVLFQALALSDLINGVSYIFAGASRRLSLLSGHYHDLIHPLECAKAAFPAFLILGGLLPSFTNFMLALERLIAIQFITFYKRSCNVTGKIVLSLIGLLGATVVWVIGMLMMNDNDTILYTRMCDVLKASGQKFGIAHFALVSFLFFVSFLLLVIVALMANRRKVSKEDTRRNRILFFITGCSVLLVATPNVVLVLQDVNALHLSDLIVGIIYCLYGISSSLNLFLYIAFRRDFRQRFCHLFLCNRRFALTVVTTTGGQTLPSRSA